MSRGRRRRLQPPERNTHRPPLRIAIVDFRMLRPPRTSNHRHHLIRRRPRHLQLLGRTSRLLSFCIAIAGWNLCPARTSSHSLIQSRRCRPQPTEWKLPLLPFGIATADTRSLCPPRTSDRRLSRRRRCRLQPTEWKPPLLPFRVSIADRQSRRPPRAGSYPLIALMPD